MNQTDGIIIKRNLFFFKRVLDGAGLKELSIDSKFSVSYVSRCIFVSVAQIRAVNCILSKDIPDHNITSVIGLRTQRNFWLAQIDIFEEKMGKNFSDITVDVVSHQKQKFSRDKPLSRRKVFISPVMSSLPNPSWWI